MGPFLETALDAFSPSMLQRWFAANGLKTVVRAGNKVYPHTDCAGDVLNFFTDRLRDGLVSLACSSSVLSMEPSQNGFRVCTDNFEVQGNYVLLATGGMSYPKTGSTGDGQQWAERLGHGCVPYRAGLVGFEVDPQVLKGRIGKVYERVTVEILVDGQPVAETRGVFEVEKWGIGGTAITDASRIAARQNLERFALRIRTAEGHSETIEPLRPRPLKEAMVTVGGVALNTINPRTMESLKCPRLYFAGEVMDVDGPTGGYNLHAAFSTARLAVASIGTRCGKPSYPPLPSASANKKRSYGKPRNRY